MGVAVGVGVGVGVASGVGVGVASGVGVGVASGVGVGVASGVGVGVASGVGVGVASGIGVTSGVGDGSVSSAQARVPGRAHSSADRSRTDNSFFQFFFMFTISSLNCKWFCIACVDTANTFEVRAGEMLRAP